MARILVVDDEPDILQLLKFNLQQMKWQVIQAVCAQQAMELAQSTHPDLIILDVMLPDMNGLEVCKLLKSRNETKKTPILLLTAKGESRDRIAGLESGADDYITKPFSPRELTLRVQAVLRRMDIDALDQIADIDIHGLHMDIRRWSVKYLGRTIPLTNLEFRLLSFLARRPGAVMSREQLLTEIWQYSYMGGTRTVDTHIRRLRRKLGEGETLIETLVGVGYRFRDPQVEASETEQNRA